MHWVKKKWREKNKEKVALGQKKWREKNPDYNKNKKLEIHREILKNEMSLEVKIIDEEKVLISERKKELTIEFNKRIAELDEEIAILDERKSYCEYFLK